MNKKKKNNFWENYRFEFTLYINENKDRDQNSKPIICQRFFNVRNFNKDVINSIEMKELMDNLVGMSSEPMGIIPQYLKEMSENYIWKNYKYFRYYAKETGDNFQNEDIFTFELKVDKKVVARSMFSGNWFPTEVRYAVNIKKIISKIINEIEYYFSLDDYQTEYEGYDLKFNRV